MKTEEIVEGNNLIAEFMGLKMISREDITEDTDIDKFCYNPRYHSDWNWLFPVIQKIFSLPIEKASPLDLADVELAWSRKDITEIWKSCIRFIKKVSR